MTKHRVFIYGSCVSRDTFEHFEPSQFELVQYVARQSAISAYTRPVTLVEPPALNSSFQQRMVTGDYDSSLRTLIPESAAQTDLVLVDLTDERLGVYVLPDGSVVTRSNELVGSGAEQYLPAGSQHLPFGSEQHFQYWSHGIAAVGDLLRQHMPRAAIVLLDVPWAERSENGAPTPESFGISAAEANPVFDAYVDVAAQALQAEVISLRPDEVLSGPDHPWGDAPFHYAGSVYRKLVTTITGGEGRDPWSQQEEAVSQVTPTARGPRSSGTRAASGSLTGPPTDTGAPNLILAGTQRGGAEWLSRQLGKLSEVFVAPDGAANFYNRPDRLGDEGSRGKHQEFFAGRGETWRAECSPNYFWHATDGPFSKKSSSAASAIREHGDPSAQILLSLRNPVERALSAYWVHFSAGKFDLPTSIFRLPSNLGVIDLGFYRKHYTHWSDHLGPDRLHVVLHDEMADPAALLARVRRDILGITRDVEATELGDLSVPDEHAAWLTLFKKRWPVPAAEVAALHALYRDDIAFVEDLMGCSLPEWSDLDLVLERLGV
ncbi:hypothetical protein ATJ88_3055 [Isoptericola jiangsuensis]|uniref:Sulfotransferase family protein n=1 Tax=Isoptericola jiangsuensis TaxID=548579 RepID=A0A2A9F015_9MICO|nr:DUF6270 domain-containing protein [Isoptericola jiangsuensis]PFG44333.1 hypothetical protein ATJ88_3055 [Isoptericola jiangsuensis]